MAWKGKPGERGWDVLTKGDSRSSRLWTPRPMDVADVSRIVRELIVAGGFPRTLVLVQKPG